MLSMLPPPIQLRWRRGGGKQASCLVTRQAVEILAIVALIILFSFSASFTLATGLDHIMIWSDPDSQFSKGALSKLEAAGIPVLTSFVMFTLLYTGTHCSYF